MNQRLDVVTIPLIASSFPPEPRGTDGICGVDVGSSWRCDGSTLPRVTSPTAHVPAEVDAVYGLTDSPTEVTAGRSVRNGGIVQDICVGKDRSRFVGDS